MKELNILYTSHEDGLLLCDNEVVGAFTDRFAGVFFKGKNEYIQIPKFKDYIVFENHFDKVEIHLK